LVPPGPAFLGSAQNSPTLINDSHWEVWPITGFSVCGGPEFLPGEYRVHLQTQSRTLADGTVITTQRINSAASLKINDVNGGEWLFLQVGDYQQVYLPSGAYRVETTQQFREISRGALNDNQTFWFTLTIVSDGVNPPVTTVRSATGCR
jgi:hypothetical protein